MKLIYITLILLTSCAHKDWEFGPEQDNRDHQYKYNNHGRR